MSGFEKFIKNHKGLKGKVSLTGYCPLSDMYWGSSESYEQYVAYEVWKHQQSEIDQLKAEKAGFQKLVKSLRSEFDLNGGSDQVERQIELLEEAVRGQHE